MKIRLTEQGLSKRIRKMVNEELGSMMVQRGTDLHFQRKSETAQSLKKIEKFTGWGVIAVKHDGNDYKFIMAPTGNRSMSQDEYIENVMDFLPTLKDVSTHGSMVILTVDTGTNKDYANSGKYAQEKWDSKANWKSPWDLDEPAGTP